MRKIDLPEGLTAPHAQPSDRVAKTRKYRFLTPLIGGGVTSEGHLKPFDPITPIRVSALRGQLRFWWRAVNPRRCTRIADLRAAEAEVFGSTECASKVDISVVKQPGAPEFTDVLRGKHNAASGMESIAYGAFPLRDTTNVRDEDRLRHGKLHDYKGREFEIRFAYPTDCTDDMIAALWAFAHFGGLGARTRRGFGAIEDLTGDVANLQDGWARWIAEATQVDWPCLCGALTEVVHRVPGNFDGLSAQKLLLGEMKKLRQGNLGRRINGKNHGRSYWPEADAIRQAVQGGGRGRHSKRETIPDKFPRGQLGMPIVFKFKDDGGGGIDPAQTTLQPVADNCSRWASRLILRPHANGGSVEPMALILHHPPLPGGAEISWGGSSAPANITITESEARGLPKSPLIDGRGIAHTDPAQRYLALLKENS